VERVSHRATLGDCGLGDGAGRPDPLPLSDAVLARRLPREKGRLTFVLGTALVGLVPAPAAPPACWRGTRPIRARPGRASHPLMAVSTVIVTIRDSQWSPVLTLRRGTARPWLRGRDS
jgi:hypothetical protein